MVCYSPKSNLRNSLARLPEPAWGPQCGRNPDESGDEAPMVCLELLPRCPGAIVAEPAALETSEEVVSISVPLHFQAGETERIARWRPLRPGTLAGLAVRSSGFLASKTSCL